MQLNLPDISVVTIDTFKLRVFLSDGRHVSLHQHNILSSLKSLSPRFIFQPHELNLRETSPSPLSMQNNLTISLRQYTALRCLYITHISSNIGNNREPSRNFSYLEDLLLDIKIWKLRCVQNPITSLKITQNLNNFILSFQTNLLSALVATLKS